MFLLEDSVWRKAIAAVLLDLSAGWFSLVFITPNFVQIETFREIMSLIASLVFGMVMLVGAVRIMRMK